MFKQCSLQKQSQFEKQEIKEDWVQFKKISHLELILKLNDDKRNLRLILLVILIVFSNIWTESTYITKKKIEDQSSRFESDIDNRLKV